MTESILLIFLFAVIFTSIQNLFLRKDGKDIKVYAKEKLENLKKGKRVQEFILLKEIKLKRYGADFFLKDGILVSEWYLYKALLSLITGLITYVLSVKVLKADAGILITTAVAILAWFFLDIYLSLENKQSNEAMMSDISEMSRSVLYGKKGGQYIIDAIKDACRVVENKRLKTSLIKLRSNLDAENVLEYEKKLRDVFRGTVKTACLHGRMKPEEKNKVMESFASGKVQVLVSTTVVEVGVNVPNATVMMIENAERFGLAALHQLRGRVGRGKAQSYCIFVNCNESNPKNKRLDILVKSNDGFYIASEDLKLRGPGDFCGIRQSGMFRFQVADIFQDADMLSLASNVTKQLMEDDPELSKEGHQGLKLYIEKTAAKQMEQLNL